MKIIFNHTLRSIRAHIGQPIVIVFTVTVVTMLFFASLVLGDLFYNFQLANLTRKAGQTDVSLKGTIISGERLKEFEEVNADTIEYVDKYLTMEGIISDEKNAGATAVVIEATDLDVFFARYKNKLSFYKGITENDRYVYPPVMISKSLADKYGYEPGSEIDVYIGLYGRYQTFTVTYVFENKGFFANSTVHNILADLSSVGDKGLYSDVYYKLKPNTDKEEFKEKLSLFLDNSLLTVDDAVDYDYIERVVGDNENLLKIALCFVIALVIFILFGAYSVVSKNRASELLVFKAAGASPEQMFALLMTEVLLYGVAGGISGVIIGRFGMELVVQSVIPSFSSAVTYHVWNYAVAVISGILISVLGSLVPFVRLVKQTVKKQSSTGVKLVKSVKPAFLIIPAVVLIGSIIGVIYLSEYATIFTVTLLVSSIALIILSAPFVMRIIAAIGAKCGGTSRLACAGTKRNSEAVSVSAMLAAVLAFSFVTISIVGVIIDASRPANSRFDAEYVVQSLSGNDKTAQAAEFLKNNEGTRRSAIFYYENFDYEFNGRQTDLTVYGVRNASDLSFATFLTEAEKERFDNEERSAVVSYDVLSRTGKKVGDKIIVKLAGKDYEFVVVAKDDKKTMNDRVIFVNLKGLDYSLKNSVVFFDVDDNVPKGDYYNFVKSKIENIDGFVLRFDDWANAATVGVDGIATLLRVLQIVVCLVGFAGIVNMTIAMSISKKKDYDIYFAAGMSREKFGRVLASESLLIGCTGAVSGCALASCINVLIPSFARLIDRYVSITFPWITFAIAGIAIVVYTAVYCFVGSRHGIKKQKGRKDLQTLA